MIGQFQRSNAVLVLVTYDVSTTTKAGRRRLARVARICEDYGQRAQHSVFECQVDPAQFAALKGRLLEIVNPDEDSLRFYFLGANWRRRVEHHGQSLTLDLDEPLIL
jgi:CRISPR-associated protein Cas2